MIKHKTGISIKHFLLLLFSLTLAGLLCCALLVFLVDPFFHYRGPSDRFSYVVNDQLTQNPGLARNTDYDSLSLGSSVTLDYDKNWFDELFSLNTLKLPYNGAYPKDIRTAMEQADKSGNELKTVFIAIDIMAYSADPDEIKYPYPEYLYDDNPVNDVNYWFNKDVLLDYIIKPALNKSLATNPNEYFSNYMNMVYGKDHVLAGYTLPEITEEQADSAEAVERMLLSVRKNFEPFIKAHPDTKFVFYYPPRSILFWIDTLRNGTFDAYMEEELAFTEFLLTEFDNTEVYFLQNDEEIITDLDRYTDTVHFDRNTSFKVLKEIKDGKFKASADNYRQFVEDFRKIVNKFAKDPVFIKSLSK